MKRKILILLTFLTTIFSSYAITLNTDKIIDKITVYSLEKYNANEFLTLRNELSKSDKEKIRRNVLKNIDFSDKNSAKFYIDNSFRDEKGTDKEKYLALLLEVLKKGKFLQTSYSAEFQKKEEDRFHYGEISDSNININDFHRLESIERFMKRATGVATELKIELVQQNIDGAGNTTSLYHLILTQKKLDNRLVAVIPYKVDIKNQEVIRIDSGFVFITPMKVYNGISEFFNTFVIKKNRYDYRFDTGRIIDEKDKNYEVIIFNNDTLKIASTRKEEKFIKYIDELLNKKMNNIYKYVIKPDFPQKDEYITQEEYNNLIAKAHRILHNYQYSEITHENNLDKQVDYKKQQKNAREVEKENKTLYIDITKYNKEEELKNLSADVNLFRAIPLDDSEVYQKDKNGYLLDKLKDEYSEYFKELLNNIAKENLASTGITIETIERYIQILTGGSTQKSIELVDVKGKKYYYHITVSSYEQENRNVFIVPVTVDIENKKITISNERLIFKTPQNVYTGAADLFNTYLNEFKK